MGAFFSFLKSYSRKQAYLAEVAFEFFSYLIDGIAGSVPLDSVSWYQFRSHFRVGFVRTRMNFRFFREGCPSAGPDLRAKLGGMGAPGLDAKTFSNRFRQK